MADPPSPPPDPTPLAGSTQSSAAPAPSNDASDAFLGSTLEVNLGSGLDLDHRTKGRGDRAVLGLRQMDRLLQLLRVNVSGSDEPHPDRSERPGRLGSLFGVDEYLQGGHRLPLLTQDIHDVVVGA